MNVALNGPVADENGVSGMLVRYESSTNLKTSKLWLVNLQTFFGRQLKTLGPEMRKLLSLRDLKQSENPFLAPIPVMRGPLLESRVKVRPGLGTSPLRIL